MKAIVRHRFGTPDVLELAEIEKPASSESSVLVRVRASSINPSDWYAMAGRPYIARMEMGLRKPKTIRLGTDFAGEVETVGKAVTEFRPGDAVFGMRTGALAEYVTVDEKKLTPMPSNLTFEEAAAVPVAAVTALQALRDKGSVQPGQKVLINGASGGVGTFAVQIAKVLNAEVTGVCSTRNMDNVGSLGADHVFDYTREDFTASGGPYDLMIDNVSSRPFSKYRRVLTPEATVVIVGGSKSNRLLGPLAPILKTRIAAIGSGKKVIFFLSNLKKDDMLLLRDLLEAGTIVPVIDKNFSLSDAAEAFRYLEEGHARGKVVVTI
ncbi:MAG: NAD(P)-dependent alcohol dehydrogenase [Actinobacteria bacterium]|nr:NAD(P)-dependent alcohol dehydrogenase [Actinomycetota bacterium]